MFAARQRAVHGAFAPRLINNIAVTQSSAVFKKNNLEAATALSRQLQNIRYLRVRVACNSSVCDSIRCMILYL